ncbi:sodium/solute symporter [uncultured Polaribacter sp.]|uniref:sodium:solute symporter family transporter n=1 Tax=uncultured Polaribacter sp. TaxID=174711 RepID=UPI002607B339|nr:sodium/solute symporter [uncultured Polaribacter sp.]
MFSQINIETVDVVIIIIYFLFIVFLGIYYGRKSKDAQSYFLADRGSGWFVIGFSMFAASISSSTLIGKAGDAYSTGIAVFNYDIVSVIVMVFFAWFFLPFYIKAKIYTIPEFLEKRFSVHSRYYFSAITIIVNIFLDAAGALYAAALVMKLVFPDASLLVLASIFAVVVAVYTIPGGLSAAIKVDLMQGVILLVGSFVVTYYISVSGGATYVKELLSSEDFMMKLWRPTNDVSVPWPAIFLGIPILGFFFWGNNQQLVQRALTGKSIDEARKGVLLVGFLTVLILFIIIIPGVMSQKVFPNLGRPDMVYPNMVIELLPNALVGFLLAAIIAALTSTLSGLLNSVATLFTMDFYLKMKPETSSQNQVWVGRIVSVIVLIIAVWWSPKIGESFDSLLKYYQEMLSIMAPPIVAVFILGVFWKRANAKGAFIGLIGGALFGVVNLLIKLLTGVSIFGNMHFLMTVPFYFLWSIIVMVVASLLTEKPNYTKIEHLIWTRELFYKETLELRKESIWKNYRFWSMLLILFSVVVFVCFL